MNWDSIWPGRRQAIIWTSAGILLIRTLGTNFSEILTEIHIFSFKKMHWKMSFAEMAAILSSGRWVNQVSVPCLPGHWSKSQLYLQKSKYFTVSGHYQRYWWPYLIFNPQLNLKVFLTRVHPYLQQPCGDWNLAEPFIYRDGVHDIFMEKYLFLTTQVSRMENKTAPHHRYIRKSTIEVQPCLNGPNTNIVLENRTYSIHNISFNQTILSFCLNSTKEMVWGNRQRVPSCSTYS